MALSFDATYYMTARTDVMNAYIAAGAEAGTGQNWAQFAEQHYDTFGWKEGANPNAIFDTSDYLAANIDVLEAGVNPFTHYLTFGANEGRAPSATFPVTLATFGWEAYLDANPDLGAAGITTDKEAYGHFVVFGQFESRPGAPVIDHGVPGVTTTLTTAIGEIIVGTANNDAFNAIVGTGATLNIFDTVDGKAGNDTANIVADAAVTAAQLSQFTSVETVNVNTALVGGQTALDISGQTDIRSFNLSGTGMAAAAVLTVGANQTVTLAGELATGDVTVAAAADVTELNVNGNAATIDLFTLTGADITTANVGGTTSAVVAIAAPATAETLNVSIENNVALTVTGAAINTLDLSGAGGTVSVTALAGMTSVVGSAQADVVTDATFAEAVTIDLGAGNDTFNVAQGDAASTVDITLGAGNDTVFVTALANLDADDIAATLISITDFNVSDDVLNIVGLSAVGIVDNVEQAAIELAANIEAAFALAATAVGTTATAVFNYKGDAYIFQNDAVAGLQDTDGAIKLTGISVSELDASNFIA